jgi:hypothetical protein
MALIKCPRAGTLGLMRECDAMGILYGCYSKGLMACRELYEGR